MNSAAQGTRLRYQDTEFGTYLLRLARRAISHYLQTGTHLIPDRNDARLEEPRGVFVTLRQRGRLRGCIGYPYPIMPLGQALVAAAVGAATQDPRFPPLRPEDLTQVRIEVSILTPPQPVERLDAIEVGRHGLIVEKGSARGLLLPEVATEYGWDRETFLAQTCLKAGLPPDAWRASDTRIFIFQTLKFVEEEEEHGTKTDGPTGTDRPGPAGNDPVRRHGPGPDRQDPGGGHGL